ncbi:MobA/MobL family protein [Sphingobium sp. B11D3D]|uniref:MobA/MobL family protein n=1 Tax=Sphingobium sp. B11D3D TaxID=2940576 RepID=UPI0022259D8E|nr:MobA/MobL family protein [Sphingobium sp. B11D3D]MCW2370050.1 hypothetical protein [Sphingobium sp. B11D3D]
MNLRTLGPIGHCSAKLRRAVAVEEEAALRWTIRIPHDPDQEKKASMGGRFMIAPSFNVPGPFASIRPTSAEGRVTFHFSEQTVTKLASGGSLITSARGHKLLGGNAAAKHDRYVARPDAVLTISASKFGNYAERDSAVEIEADKAAVFSNISEDPEVRRKFWLAVHKHERSGKPDHLVFSRALLPAESWKDISDEATLPVKVREIAKDLAQAPLIEAKEPKVTLELDAAECRKICGAMQMVCGDRWNAKQPGVKVVRGRNGRTQFRLTAEFPLGIDAAARVRITQRFCNDFGELGAMYTAAIHAPDGYNDERNHHLHLAYYDRPCSIVPELGMWDFEIREKVAGQHERFRYPYRQPKISELGRDPSGGSYRKYRASMIYGWRERFAELCNEELRQVGISRLFDPRKYSEMGIDRDPTEPLGRNAAPLEAAGVSTPAGRRNAEIIWTAELWAALKADEKRRVARKNQLKRLLDAAGHLAAKNLIGESNSLLSKAEEIRTQSLLLDAHELEMDEFRVTLEMAYARPDKTIATCSRLLETLEAGKGTRSDRANEYLIRERKAAAEAFGETIREIMDQSMTSIAPILDQVEEARRIIESVLKETDNLVTRAFELHSGGERREEPVAEKASQNVDTPRDEIDIILRRIMSEDMLVLAPDENAPFFRVPSISREEFKTLSADRSFVWVQKRLEGIAEVQSKRRKAVSRPLAAYKRPEIELQASTNQECNRVSDRAEAYIQSASPGKLVNPPRQETAPHKASPIAVARAEEPVVPARSTAAISSGQLSDEVSVSRTPTSYAVHDPKSDDARKEAILAFAHAILTEPGVVIDFIDGEHRVDASTMPDWCISVLSFEGEASVKVASKERWAAALERERRSDRGKMIDELRMSKCRPLERDGDRWIVTHVSEKFKAAVSEWPTHPELHAAYEDIDRTWKARERNEADSRAPQLDEKKEDLIPTQAPSVKVGNDLEGYSIEEQAYYLALRNGLNR